MCCCAADAGTRRDANGSVVRDDHHAAPQRAVAIADGKRSNDANDGGDGRSVATRADAARNAQRATRAEWPRLRLVADQRWQQQQQQQQQLQLVGVACQPPSVWPLLAARRCQRPRVARPSASSSAVSSRSRLARKSCAIVASPYV